MVENMSISVVSSEPVEIEELDGDLVDPIPIQFLYMWIGLFFFGHIYTSSVPNYKSF